MPLLGSGLTLSDPYDDVRGLTVLDPDGHRVGDVEDLVIDETHRRARLLVVTSGGVLGLGETRRFIPVDLVTCVDEHVHMARVHPGGPDDDPTARAAGDDPDLVAGPPYADVYASYGFAPFWGMDYVTPYFHRR
ncbi:PRC-barrel domain-containing protein [Nocardioides islandensis]|uniref:PRC-barrel domain-containing protein n=1 Tax=Nocardioides islandensis TaxID=433663 RepID=A0A930VI86_9ACTN|nr:PRC-barrel domain-containing protein [Nocardioides islandensis]MBF4764410.1 PRC-barrel domain-containing protein [Nocardioides islandensis]